MAEYNNPTPRFRLDGEINDVLADTLISLEVIESLDSAARCRARFVNVGSDPHGDTVYLYFDRSILDFGVQLTVGISFGQAATSIFEGSISALEAAYRENSPPEFLVLAEDAFHEMWLPHRTRLFHDLIIPDIITNIASEHGLEVQAELLSNYPHHAVLAQFEQSDLSFLYDLARSEGIDLWVRQGALVMRDARAAGGEIKLVLGEELLSYRARADLAEQITSLSVTGWDVQGKQVVGATVGEAAIQNEINGWHSGSDNLQAAFGERHERLPASLPSSTDEAQALAEAAYRQRARRFVSGVALVQGDPQLRVGGRVRLDGLGDMFSGPYFIEKARHLFDRQSGYRTELYLSRAGLEPKRGTRRKKGTNVARVQKNLSKAAGSAKKATGREL